MFQVGGIQLISDLRWSDRECSHYSCDSKWHDQSLQMCILFHVPVLFIPVTNQSLLYFHLIPLPSLNHFGHVPPSFPDFSPLVPGQSVKQGCSFYTFPLLHIFFSPSPNHTPLSIISILPLSLYPFPFLSICVSLSSLNTLLHTVIPTMFPYCLSNHILSPKLLSISFSSLPLLQILLDSHSPPGLNHQDLLEGPNHGSVSPQRGFCLLTVETNDLHALCLWSVPRHLEAVEVITVKCLTRRGTAHSHTPPLHLPLTVKAALF